MALDLGTRVGPYEITAPIGVGGMGEVYRAKDTKLKRDVAIKVLPDDVARDSDRLLRFEREAQVLASLNHPHIAAIYGLEESDGVPCLVLELVEGQTLADMLAQGSLTPDKALHIARQIASALEAAHEKGIIHRDLKPANVMVTPEESAKVLDFGLAKALVDDPVENGMGASLSPTLTAAATRAGTILGTASYMSPEQARGKPVDRQADIWAFGCVLFEMLTGRQAFPGETASDAIARILEREPDWQELPAGTSPKIRELLQRCLQRDHRNRLHDIADARIEIDEILANPSSASASASDMATQQMVSHPRWLLVLPWVVVVVLVGLLGWRSVQQPAPLGSAEWFSVVPPRSTSGVMPGPVVSPDGNSVVFRAMNDAGEVTLWVRSFGSTSARQLSGTEGDPAQAFWSPDGQSVAFFDFLRGKLKRVDIADGTVEVLADAANARGGTWSVDGKILFTPTISSGLHVMSASGGTSARVTTPGPGTEYHTWPHFLPDGKRFLFLAGKYLASGLFLGSLDSQEIQRLTDFQSRVEYVDGYLLYGDGDAVLARRFDPDEAEFTGEPVRLAGRVGLNLGDSNSHAFSVARDVLVSSSGGWNPETQLLSMDRQGRRLRTYDIAGYIDGISLSPDETTLAVEILNQKTKQEDVWVTDLATGVMQRFQDGVGMPVWSPDGSRLLMSNWVDAFIIKGMDGELEEFVHGMAVGFPQDWSSDGKYLLCSQTGPKTGEDIWSLPMTGDPSAVPLVQSRYNEMNPSLSGDSRWMAYDSDESGRYEVYVQSFPDGKGRQRVSTNGGWYSLWREDGKELYYIADDGAFMAVPITATGSDLTIGRPQALFQAPRLLFYHRRAYAVLDNGERFLFNAVSERSARSITILRNWKSLLDEQ
jgi:serine/threonine protein kinase/Tol biopolymer transport system component